MATIVGDEQRAYVVTLQAQSQACLSLLNKALLMCKGFISTRVYNVEPVCVIRFR